MTMYRRVKALKVTAGEDKKLTRALEDCVETLGKLNTKINGVKHKLSTPLYKQNMDSALQNLIGVEKMLRNTLDKMQEDQ